MENARRLDDKARPKRPLLAWFDVRRDRLGTWAFALNRLTGLGLTLYLFLHLGVLSLLAQGPEGWEWVSGCAASGPSSGY